MDGHRDPYHYLVGQQVVATGIKGVALLPGLITEVLQDPNAHPIAVRLSSEITVPWHQVCYCFPLNPNVRKEG